MKLMWTEDEKRYVLKNHKTVSLEDMADHLSKSEKAVKSQCNRMYCSYFTKNSRKRS